ncbi:MAG: hypothetical protein OEN22_05065, partial [Gammaproteobacteria bacterium]|nr:hypothetical protein [Gammaproteobacteria bacterium]
MPTTLSRDVDATDRVTVGGLSIDTVFCDFVEDELLAAIGIEAGRFWRGLESLIDELTPVNRELLQTRDALQEKIDAWHKA